MYIKFNDDLAINIAREIIKVFETMEENEE